MKALMKMTAVLLLTAVSGWVLAVGQININSADAEALANGLEGVGPAKAEAIVTHRNENGPFESVEALANVKGIGPKVLELNIERITVEGE